jgi:hypothetical protein
MRGEQARVPPLRKPTASQERGGKKKLARFGRDDMARGVATVREKFSEEKTRSLRGEREGCGTRPRARNKGGVYQSVCSTCSSFMTTKFGTRSKAPVGPASGSRTTAARLLMDAGHAKPRFHARLSQVCA